MFGVDGHCLNWWKRRKKGQAAPIVKKRDENPLQKGKLESQKSKEAMACTIDYGYCYEGIDGKNYKWKQEADYTAVIVFIMEIDSFLLPPALMNLS
ncbi:unnamed protein product [Linum trigynum]|uniref:Uncharacterized protein n=1 Tax=Linum trigynum TaxID=586398 RepID=A0AAV2FQI6_9ROSI